MKKIFITTLLFLMALCALAFPDNDIAALLQYGPVDLAYGIKKPEPTNLADFEIPVQKTDYQVTLQSVYEPIPFSDVYNSWYNADFAKDPFDGLVEVYVVGEPLPSPGLTFMVALGTLLIIMWSRKQPKRA